MIADIVVERAENVYPMIPGGAAHNEIKLSPEDDGAARGDLGGGDGAGLSCRASDGHACARA